MNPTDESDFQRRLQRVELLVQRIERSTDPAGQEASRELVRALLELHAVGLGRLLGLVAAAGDAGRGVLDACAADDLVAQLLLLHGLHPQDLGTRVGRAVEGLLPQFRARRAGLVLLGVRDGVARLRLECADAAESARLRGILEEALVAAAPDLAGLEVEEAAPAAATRLVALPLVGDPAPRGRSGDGR